MSYESPEERFFAQLKQASDTNENESVQGENKLPGDAVEPSKSKEDCPDTHSQAAVRSSQQERGDFVEELLADKSKADSATQALMAANFTHVASGDFSAHSVHLRPKMKTAMLRQPTLREAVVRVVGRT